MKYLILKTPSVDYAKEISRFIYGMSIPTFSEVTQYYCSWIVHPKTNEVALAFNENDSLPISVEANPVLLVDTIRAAITVLEATALEALIANANTPIETEIEGLGGELITVSSVNNRINPIEHIPASLASNIKTEAEMEADGWYRPTLL
jgi:hypothetical protein